MNRFDVLRETVVTLFKRKKVFLGTLGATVVVVIIGVLIIPPTYSATSSLLVKFGREYMYSPEVGDARQPYNYFNPDGAINVEIQILTSKDLARKLIDKVGLENIYPGMTSIEGAVNRFQQDLWVRGAPSSDVIHATFQHRNPETAAEVVNLLVDLFVEERLRIFSDSSVSSYFEEKVGSYNQDLRDAELSFQNFKSDNSTYSYFEQQNLLMRRSAELDASIHATEDTISELERKVHYLEDQLELTPETKTIHSDLEANPILAEAENKLLTLRLRESELLAKYTDTNRLVRDVRDQIKLLEDFVEEQEQVLQKEVREGENQLFRDIKKELIIAQADLRAANAKLGVIRKQKADVESQLTENLTKEREYDGLRRQVQISEKIYDAYRQKLEEYRISSEMDRDKVTSIRVIQTASVPVSPTFPRKGVLVFTGFIVGALLGIVVAVVVDYMDQSINTSESLEKRLQLPVLTTIPNKGP